MPTRALGAIVPLTRAFQCVPGAVAGLLSNLPVASLERIKVRRQVVSNPTVGAHDFAKGRTPDVRQSHFERAGSAHSRRSTNRRAECRRRASQDAAGGDREETHEGCHPRESGGPESPPPAPRKSVVQRLVKVSPVWIEPLDQLELPPSLPFLQLLLTRDRLPDVAVMLVPNERLDAVLRGELRADAVAMLKCARSKMVGDSDIERFRCAGWP